MRHTTSKLRPLWGLLGIALAAACTETEVAPAAEQSVRPARLFVVEESAQTQVYDFVGRVEAAQSIDMAFEVTGPLAQIPILEGETVTKGGLIAALDATAFELAVREAEMQLKLAAQDLDRKRNLLQNRGIAKSVVDDAQTNFQLQRVRLDQARESLADSRLEAPFDAYVSRRYLDNFVYVSAGQPIARLSDHSRLLVVANIPEGLRATATQDQVVRIFARFDFATDAEFDLTFHETRGEADAVAQTYEVSFSMSVPEAYTILPGMTATVVVELRDQKGSSATLIPTSALVAGADDRFYVWVYDPETQGVSRRSVDVATPLLAGVPVRAGLKDGDMIVATGASQLSEGMRVRPLGEPQRGL